MTLNNVYQNQKPLEIRIITVPKQYYNKLDVIIFFEATSMQSYFQQCIFVIVHQKR